MQLNFDELRELLTTLNKTDITEFTLKSEAFEIVVRRETGLGDRSLGVLSPSSPMGGTEFASSGATAGGQNRILEAPSTRNEGSAAPPIASPPPPTVDKKWLEIISPMVGTFYRAPAPDEPPFVDVGDRIRTGQTVCIIEAMKLMNELEAEVSGEVVEILVQNGDPVEYGQVLMRVNPG
ncbi:MAG: acetyl-CoA carboxylase biotin carboxyl carrier protein [Leptolyngbyaceae cyanobacterium bins.59]|nr:acetyl-CoA carboxylase biotin carboxyl carrier protein [Leptolyngbyaceae cyanobacterium bins.59]